MGGCLWEHWMALEEQARHERQPRSSNEGAMRVVSYVMFLTIVFEQLVLVAALPDDAALLGSHEIPWAQVYGSLVGRVVE